MYSVTTRFNRYIVECKVVLALSAVCFAADLIDTLWNVKKTFLKNISGVSGDLIDTLWNVKSIQHSLYRVEHAI